MAKYEQWLTEDGLAKIEKWANDGLTDEQIAHNMGVGYRTFCEWKVKYSQIQQSLKKGKEPADQIVENALFKSATGFSVKLRKPVKVRRRGGNEEVEYHEEEMFIAPNVTAQIYWLKNRRRDRWKDKPEESGTNEQVSEILQSIYDMKKGNGNDSVER